jgi:hypothetical protein
VLDFDPAASRVLGIVNAASMIRAFRRVGSIIIGFITQTGRQLVNAFVVKLIG